MARDIAQVVDASVSASGYFHGNGYAVTWAVGHLVALPEPHQIDPKWKRWSFVHLPMFPETWPLKVVDKTREQFEVVRKLLEACDEIICAMDAGREGELIFRYIYEASACEKPVRRLWISSLTVQAIQSGLKNLRPGRDFDGLAAAARARSQADWLVGMNLSRAYALSTQQPLFVGRVQTPTLAMVVERDRQIRDFPAEDYWVVDGTFNSGCGDYVGLYMGETWPVTDSTMQKQFSRAEKEKLTAGLEDLRRGKACVRNIEVKDVRQGAPQFYDLTELQRHCNQLFGFTAAITLELAQSLYEQHKVITYPRTDSRYLSQTVAATLPKIVDVIRGPYESHLGAATGVAPLDSRHVNDSRVTDHHAIIPTAVKSGAQALSVDEQKVYDLICRRLLMAWQAEHVTEVTTVITEINGRHVFRTLGTRVALQGWKALEVGVNASEATLPSGLSEHQEVQIVALEYRQMKTDPPPHLTDATLLSGMETAGRHLENRELADHIRPCGLGTPATRASIIETLVSRKYLERRKNFLVATPLGHQLIETVHESVKSPALTAAWEKKLAEIQHGKLTPESFLSELKDEIAQRICEIKTISPPAGFLSRTSPLTGPNGRKATAPNELRALLRERFHFDEFRAGQEEICRAVTEGHDVLLVMPTGAGKSICYQLPGLARAGTTLVISPLVSLIEDQVSKLQRLGLAAERIHSGRAYEDSLHVRQRFLAGELDYLFIAPERLAAPGFPELLRLRPPVLIAIDEAHCISHWGHDFRTDYRRVGERLKQLRPVPVVALTATATPYVQNDICQLLGLENEKRFICGFRRSNISIHVTQMAPGDRAPAIRSLLRNPESRPAMIYVPTRKKADELAQDLSGLFAVGTYHAGLLSKDRDQVQSRYLEGELDVLVATTAFGMGIDKSNVRTVIHAAAPASVEGYYQEIGRAGRDGLLSRAYLFHSPGDLKTHESLFAMTYPPIRVLEDLYAELRRVPEPIDVIRSRLAFMDPDVFSRALALLWANRGALIDPAENILRGERAWEDLYALQRAQKRTQLEQVAAFVASSGCRILELVSHFGDSKDAGQPCGICDRCQTGLFPNGPCSGSDFLPGTQPGTRR